MNATDIQQNDNARAEYVEWLNNPMTQYVIGILRQEGRCNLPPPEQMRAENGLVEAGKNTGWHACIDRMISLNIQLTGKVEPVATFGAEELAKEMGVKFRAESQKGDNNE